MDWGIQRPNILMNRCRIWLVELIRPFERQDAEMVGLQWMGDQTFAQFLPQAGAHCTLTSRCVDIME